MYHFYIYYRLGVQQASCADSRIQALFDTVEARTGVRGRLRKKLGEPPTWMEVYENVPDPEAFSAALEAAVGALRFDALLAPGAVRNTERFID